MKKVTAFVVLPSGESLIEQWDKDDVYGAVRSVLDNGWLEGISGDGWTAYLDEEGKIKGLPLNYRATLIATALGWGNFGPDVLCGPVVFLGPPDDEGNDTGVRKFVLDVAEVI